MVLVNYQGKLRDLILSQLLKLTSTSSRLMKAIKTPLFQSLVFRIYEYCEQLNIIETRQLILRKETKDIQGLQPKLLESQVEKVKTRTKEVGHAYSLFLLANRHFKTKHSESKFFEDVLEIIVNIMKEVFTPEEFFQLRKQINRLFRTNTFNTKLCYQELLQKGKIRPALMHDKFTVKRDVNFSQYRREVKHQRSQIKPYLNNKTCLRTKQTRSPIVSLLHPTTEYTVFNFQHKRSLRSASYHR